MRDLHQTNVLISMPQQKVIFHLEAFVAKFMRIYEGYVPNRPYFYHI